MALKPKNILTSLGYKVDEKGNVFESNNQIAVVSLENTPDGGVLRLHSDPERFFYEGDEMAEELELAYPNKVTTKFVL